MLHNYSCKTVRVFHPDAPFATGQLINESDLPDYTARGFVTTEPKEKSAKAKTDPDAKK